MKSNFIHVQCTANVVASYEQIVMQLQISQSFEPTYMYIYFRKRELIASFFYCCQVGYDVNVNGSLSQRELKCWSPRIIRDATLIRGARGFSFAEHLTQRVKGVYRRYSNSYTGPGGSKGIQTLTVGLKGEWFRRTDRRGFVGSLPGAYARLQFFCGYQNAVLLSQSVNKVSYISVQPKNQ